MELVDKIKSNLKSNMVANIVIAVGAVALIVSLFTYAAAISDTTAYAAPVTVFTVLGLVVMLFSIVYNLKGFAPLISALFTGLAFGIFLVSRMEDFGLIQVGIGTFGSMGGYVATIIFYGIALIACVVSTFLIKKDED